MDGKWDSEPTGRWNVFELGSLLVQDDVGKRKQ